MVVVAGRDAAWAKAWAAAAVVVVVVAAAAGVGKGWARGEAAAKEWAGGGTWR